MTINIISETPYFPKAHGVHTAFLNQVEMLRQTGETVWVNSSRKADITHSHTLGLYSYYKIRRNHPSVITAHVIPDSLVGSLKGVAIWGGFAISYLRHIYNSADLVLAVAPRVETELRATGVKTRIEVFPNPINTDH
ncbi:MAG TPA: glycosyltransferase, partial [Patescibacteria group bacterium]|nr:glycosyltransferase [Patescibacteria group bacterium]